ncbi:MAG: T9SS type A sorting domain-containing protein, partial [Crocinitomicaceae bacterium]
ASYTYAWTPSTDLDDATSASPVASNSTTETYTVTATNALGCTGTADVTATVNPLYTPTVTIASGNEDNEICSGDAVTFTATAVDAGNPTYVWNIGGSPVSGETASVFTTTTLVNADEVTVTVTADNTCQTVNDVTSSGITTTVNAAPTITTATDLTTGANTCGVTELSISHSGTGGNGAWTFSGGTVAFTSGSSTDATISVQPIPTDVNTDITMTWIVDGGEACEGSTISKVIRFNQPTAIANPDTYCYLWGGLTSTDITTGDNWYKWNATQGLDMWERQSSSPGALTDKLHVLITDNNCIHATNTPIYASSVVANSLNVNSGTEITISSDTLNISGDIDIDGTVTIASGAVLDADGNFDATGGNVTFSGAGTLQVSNSTVTSFGALDEATGTVVYDGTGAQTIDEAETFYSLKVDNASGVTLNTAVGVNGTLNMTSGNIVNPSNILTLGSSAGAGTLNHTSGIITGKLRQYFVNATGFKFFPIGNSTIMRDVTVDFTSAPGENQYLTASYNAGHPQATDGSDLYSGLPLTTGDGQIIQNYDDEGYWEIIPGSSSTGDNYTTSINSQAYNVSLHCNNLTGADNVTNMDRTKVRIIKSAGPVHTSWEALTHVSVSGTDADFMLTGSGTGFSFFGAGTDDDNALPVELVSFKGSCNDGVVDLVWQTASENNSEDFEVEYSRDGVDWDLIHTEPAAGFSTELISYTYEHKQAISGDNYYRLTQNDIDGASVIYENLIINASCQSTSNGYFSIFPNPSGSTFQVVMNNPEIEGAANINIVDTKGNKVFTKPILVNSGINMFVIQQELAPGIYYINVENGSRTTTILKQSIR